MIRGSPSTTLAGSTAVVGFFLALAGCEDGRSRESLRPVVRSAVRCTVETSWTPAVDGKIESARTLGLPWRVEAEDEGVWRAALGVAVQAGKPLRLRCLGEGPRRLGSDRVQVELAVRDAKGVSHQRIAVPVRDETGLWVLVEPVPVRTAPGGKVAWWILLEAAGHEPPQVAGLLATFERISTERLFSSGAGTRWQIGLEGTAPSGWWESREDFTVEIVAGGASCVVPCILHIQPPRILEGPSMVFFGRIPAGMPGRYHLKLARPWTPSLEAAVVRIEGMEQAPVSWRLRKDPSSGHGALELELPAGTPPGTHRGELVLLVPGYAEARIPILAVKR